MEGKGGRWRGREEDGGEGRKMKGKGGRWREREEDGGEGRKMEGKGGRWRGQEEAFYLRASSYNPEKKMALHLSIFGYNITNEMGAGEGRETLNF